MNSTDPDPPPTPPNAPPIPAPPDLPNCSRPVFDRCAFPGHRPPISLPLITAPPHACAYLAGRETTVRGFATRKMPADLYHAFMDAGFRRSGELFYQPICRGCRACLPIRIPVERFAADKSQRRARRANQDLVVSCSPPALTDEKYELYRRYKSTWHGTRTSGALSRAASNDAAAEPLDSPGVDPSPEHLDDREALEAFLYRSPVETLEFCYRDLCGRLLGVGICDICTLSLSSVYFYFDPDERRRSPGTFSALYEIEYARRLGIPHYYLGFWVAGCRAMEYKTRFNPHEILCLDGIWR